MNIKRAKRNLLSTTAALCASLFFLSPALAVSTAQSHESIGSVELDMPLSEVREALLMTNLAYEIEPVTPRGTEEVIGYAGYTFNEETDESDVFVVVTANGKVAMMARDRILHGDNTINLEVLVESLREKYGESPRYESDLRDSSYTASWHYDENKEASTSDRICGTETRRHFVEGTQSISFPISGSEICSAYIDVSAYAHPRETNIGKLSVKISNQMAIYEEVVQEEARKEAQRKADEEASRKRGVDL